MPSPLASVALLAPPPPILPRVARGDAVAIRECVEHYGPLVMGMARRFEPTDPDDAVQDIFVALWKNAARFDQAIGSEAAFVATIARRRLIDRRRRAGTRREKAGIELVELPAPVAMPDRAAEAAIAARVLATLRPEQQQVLTLCIYHGLTHEEIAEQLKMPLGTVKTHARRGLSKIRAALLGVDEEESS